MHDWLVFFDHADKSEIECFCNGKLKLCANVYLCSRITRFSDLICRSLQIKLQTHCVLLHKWNCYCNKTFLKEPPLEVVKILIFIIEGRVEWSWLFWQLIRGNNQSYSVQSILHKKWSFSLRISSVNLTKSVGNWGFSHIYWRNP